MTLDFISSDELEIKAKLIDLDRECKDPKYKHHALIIEDLNALLPILKYSILETSFSTVIVMTTLAQYKQVYAKIYCLYTYTN